MFREMMINFDNRPVSKQERLEVLKKQPRGVLAVLGDDDYPYCMPLDYWYSEEENRIYFHSGIKGHKVDAIKKHEKVCFCICNEGYREDGDWSLNIISIIAFGKVVIIDDYEKAMDICRQLSYKFTGARNMDTPIALIIPASVRKHNFLIFIFFNDVLLLISHLPVQF